MDLTCGGYNITVDGFYFITTVFYRRYSGFIQSTNYRSTTVDNKTRIFIAYIRRGDLKKH